MSPLFKLQYKSSIAGFIVVDVTNGDDAPTALRPTGLFSRSAKPSFFRITDKTYKRTRKNVEKLIARHYVTLEQLRAHPSKMRFVHKKEDLKLKVKSISHEILSAQ